MNKKTGLALIILTIILAACTAQSIVGCGYALLCRVGYLTAPTEISSENLSFVIQESSKIVQWCDSL